MINNKIKIIIELLQLKGIGRKTIFSILESAENYEVSLSQPLLQLLNEIKIKDNKLLNKLSSIKEIDVLNAEKIAFEIITKSESKGIKIISYFDEQYPPILKKMSDPPIILNYRGDISILHSYKGIAIIGTREPTPEGVKAALHFGEIFAQNGYNIISGLAFGCDILGHQGCLFTKGKTTAIMGSGLDDECIYPSQHLYVAKDILKKGGVLISEYFVGSKVNRNFLIERDRIQAGLSCATVVIQTGEKGGSFHAINATLASNKRLACIQYTNLKTETKILGNENLIKENKAFPLTSKNVQEFLTILKEDKMDNIKSNNRKIKGIIFDLDQTLVDSGIAEGLRKERNWQGVYDSISFFRLYEGLPEVFKYIKDNKLQVAIVSNAPSTYVKKVLEWFKIPNNAIVAYHDVKKRKPYPEPMEKALSLINLEKNEVISFGDKMDDILSSNSAGIESVACTWGSSVNEFSNCKPTYIIKSPKEIINLL